MNVLPGSLIAVELLAQSCPGISAKKVDAAISNGLRVVRVGYRRFALGEHLLATFPELTEGSSTNVD